MNGAELFKKACHPDPSSSWAQYFGELVRIMPNGKTCHPVPEMCLDHLQPSTAREKPVGFTIESPFPRSIAAGRSTTSFATN